MLYHYSLSTFGSLSEIPTGHVLPQRTSETVKNKPASLDGSSCCMVTSVGHEMHAQTRRQTDIHTQFYWYTRKYIRIGTSVASLFGLLWR